MIKKVHIIHSSIIVQNGLEAILLKSFRCLVKCYDDIGSFTNSVNHHSNSILFIENDLTGNTDFKSFITQHEFGSIFKIINKADKIAFTKDNSSIYLNDTFDEIYEKVKIAFRPNEIEEEKSEDLTNREIEVLKLIALGNSNKEIAEKLFISTHTVMSHRKNMTEKLGIKSISGLTVYAIMNNYIDTSNLETNNLI